jgi:DNA mismatch repair protein MutL
MAKIAILSQHLVNKIAAGEVVERPGSVVKELMENSLDAGAQRITVDIEDGGKKLIRICDDGCGMDVDDIKLAVHPHATSKIVSDDDLAAISTMGFRGEALASIASVSQLEIVSRTADAIEGWCLRSDGGQVIAPVPAAASVGTAITIRNLFFNTPARRKFLRTTQTELGHITEQFIRIAMGHNHLGLTLNHNGKEIHSLPANQSIRQRVGVLFSAALAGELIPVQRNDRQIEVTGLIGPPQQSRANAQWQYVFLNGRYIRDRFISHAIREAYRSMMEVSRQPVVFLFINMPPDMVDVNVHPAKMEVRFADSNAVHSQILAAIRDRLLSSDLSVSLRGDNIPPGRDHATGPASQSNRQQQESPDQRQERVRSAMTDFFKSHSVPPVGAGKTPSPGPYGPASQKTGYYSPPPPRNYPATPPGPAEYVVLPQKQDPAQQAQPFVQIHNSYIVQQDAEGLTIIDQHALHERLIYEKLLQQLNEGPLHSQRSLIPEVIDVTPEQMAVVEGQTETLETLGVMLERFGPHSVAIQGFPVLLDQDAAITIVGDLLGILVEQSGGISRVELMHSILDMMACKAAVKAGDSMTADEIKSLLAQRSSIQQSGNCPHGRPTTLKLSLAQLEKMFRRT